MLIVESVREQMNAPYASVCRSLDVPYSSLMRWKDRRAAGEPIVEKPGPGKVEPPDLDVLKAEVLDLKHGLHRTRDTGALYQRHRDAISRRELHQLVESTRRELRQEEQALERRVECLVPGAVWSMDDTHKHWLHDDRFGHMLLVIDLASRYNLRAFGEDVQSNGWQVALQLEDLFHRHGRPLFLKIDGGGNFRHEVVRHTLAEYGVIPLVSPPHYPPYNGSVERAHQEILRQLNARIGTQKIPAHELQLHCELSAHEINHKPRRSLGERTACHALNAGRQLSLAMDRRERKEVFEEITRTAVDIGTALTDDSVATRETAFRLAAETWMQTNGIIRVSQNNEVLPPFQPVSSH